MRCPSALGAAGLQRSGAPPAARPSSPGPPAGHLVWNRPVGICPVLGDRERPVRVLPFHWNFWAPQQRGVTPKCHVNARKLKSLETLRPRTDREGCRLCTSNTKDGKRPKNPSESASWWKGRSCWSQKGLKWDLTQLPCLLAEALRWAMDRAKPQFAFFQNADTHKLAVLA